MHSLCGACANPTVLPMKPLERNTHHPENPRALCGAVPVGAAARNKRKMIDQRPEANNIFSGVARVSNLDAVDAVRDEHRDSLASSRMRGMREDSEAPSPMNEPNRVRHREAFLRDVRGTTIAEVPIERVSEIDRPPLGDHGTRNVWTSDRAASGLLHHRLEIDPYAELVETRDDSRRAVPAHLPKPHKLGLERPGVGQMQTENVRFAVAFHGAELDARDDAHAELGAGGRCFRDAVDRVVISERDRGQPDSLRFADDVGRRSRPVGRCGMRMQVDVALSRLRRWRRARHAE